MGHDFNHLLSVILGGLGLLREELPPSAWNPELDQVLDDVTSAAQEAADVMAQLTAWAGHQALTPDDTDLARFVRELAPLLRRALPPAITLSLRDPAAPVMAYVDPSRLQAAVMELAANARDALGPRGNLVLAAGLDDEIGPCISVIDDGEGMAPEVESRCTEPYFTTRGEGTRRGTGLSVVDGFARASGGRLLIASAPGAGTRVTLHLPPSREGLQTAPGDADG
jgi:signal transduction histidine kinase